MIPPSAIATPPAAEPSSRNASAPHWRTLALVGLTAVTAYSTGVGWQAQLVSYPLYRSVGAEDFLAYHEHYNEAIPLVVIVPGFVSFLASIGLPWTRPEWVSPRAATLVAAAGATSLVATVAGAIPAHHRLDHLGQHTVTIDSLLSANLIRSVALTVAAAGLCAAITRHLGRAGVTRQPTDRTEGGAESSAQLPPPKP